MDGTVFSFEEFATFDGPGIRLTVFLKGCPLRCEWCHNPEGQRFQPDYLRGNAGCLNCGACLAAGERETGERCLSEASIAACPRHLVRCSGTVMTPEELCARIEKNAPMLNAAGGGVTFSGGEPLAQPEFLLDCLIRLRGITHRAVQTSGFCPPDRFAAILAETDYFLYDLKLIDEADHRRYTGVSNRDILANYRALASSGKPFVTRIPLIPGVTDTEQNLTAAARLMRENGVGRVEVLPYNKMAGSKYSLLGRAYSVSFDEKAEPNPRPEIFRSFGIKEEVL